MSIYSSAYLKTVKRNKPLLESRRLFSESQEREVFDIFLSHSYVDKDDVEGLYYELTGMGFSVYVDWIVDPHLDRSNVTKATATLVRRRLHSSKSLLLAISVDAALSKWIPWELGYVDGHTTNCALIPVSKSTVPTNSYRGVEYLSLYPFITKVQDVNNIQRLWVVEEARRYTTLQSWLIGEKPYERNTNIY
jgi:hypothetical protein